MSENETVSKKPLFPLSVRIIAFILAVLLAGEIIFSNAVAVNFSSQKYEGSEYEHSAEYIEQNDDYLTADTLSRMRSVVSLLGEPNTYEQFSLFASVAIADEKYDEAADYLLKAVELYEGDETGLITLYIKIGCLKALGAHWGSAASFFEKATELDGTNPAAWLMLCESYLNLDSYEDALSALKTYSSLVGQLSAEEFDALMQLQISLEKYDDALVSCDEAEKIGTADIAAIALYRAQIYYMKGDYPRSLENAEISRSNGGDAVKTSSLIALCSEEAGDSEKALSAYLALIDSGLADLAVCQQAAQDAYILSDYETVIRVSEAALAQFGDSEDTLVFRKWLGIACCETNDYPKAEENLAAAINGGESTPELIYLLGVCEMGNGKFEEAVTEFTSVIDSDELLDEALYNRALCYIQLNEPEAAAADFQEVIDRDSSEEIISIICELLDISDEELEASRQAEQSHMEEIQR